MPVVRMEIVDIDQICIGSAQRLAGELYEIIRSEDGHTWLRIVSIPTNHYAENHLVDAARTDRPVFVEVQRCGCSKRMAAASTAILGRNRDNVRTTFSEPLVVRIALGDNLK